MSKQRINKDQINLSSWKDNLRFHLKRGEGHLLRYALNRFRWYWYPRFHRLTKYPEHIDIELSSACNMKCPMCYTITDQFKSSVKRKNMEWDMIKKIIDEAAKGKVFSIRLSWRGESTLNKRFVDTIRYAKRAGIKEVSSLTNALRLSPEMFEEMVHAGMDWLTISVDGVGETYNQIRKPAKFEDLLVKLQAYKEIKKKLKSSKPVVKVQSIWPAIQKNPQAYFDTYSSLVDQVTVNQLVDYLQQDDEIVYADGFDCPVLYQRLTIGADGRFLLCYNDEFDKHVLGNLYEGDTIASVWNGVLMQEARDAHRQHRGVQKYEACAKCFLPREHESYQKVKVGGREVEIDKLKGRPQVIGA